MKTAIFFGAGASAAEGAPIQNALFRNFFALPPGEWQTLVDMHAALGHYFGSVFGLSVGGGAGVNYPTFEEALGVLDLSVMRCESLRGFNVDLDADPHSPSLLRLRHYLILAMGKAIDDGLWGRVPNQKNPPPPERQHQKLIRRLEAEGLLGQTVFVSTNYDLLIDEALGKSSVVQRRGEKMLDYGVEFTKESDPHEAERVHPRAIKLYKIHGSLGWLYCSTCNNLRRFEYKVVLECIFNIDAARCVFCQTLMSPMIVPPTYYKDMSNVFLSTIWNKTECGLRDVEHIIFCGYSFPDADMHIKYLLKRVQTNRARPEAMRFTVINKDDNADEAARYRRFLGGGVTYKGGATFEQFADNPRDCY